MDIGDRMVWNVIKGSFRRTWVLKVISGVLLSGVIALVQDVINRYSRCSGQMGSRNNHYLLSGDTHTAGAKR